jgi:glutathione synthase/RimK-type ligase-like ATP-grasp enzyme
VKKILITDILKRKAFDVIAILKDRFPDVPLILGSDKLSIFRILLIKLMYHGKIVVLRTDSYDHFAIDMEHICEKYVSDDIIYLPIEEQTTDYFFNFIEHNNRFIFLLPLKRTFDLLRNKYTLNKFCFDNGIPVPSTYELSSLSSLPDSAFPIVLKPQIGFGSRGIFRLSKKLDITEEIKKVTVKEPYLIQEMIPDGKKVRGTFFLCYKGNILCSYSHERIRTSPPSGGVSVMSKMDDNATVLETGKKLLKLVGWTGLVMLEFLFDPRDGQYKIIEANPRIWGSILLSEYSGANLLTNYINICLGRKLVYKDINKTARVRWFFPVEVLNYIKNMGKIADFWNFNNTCFINATYASFKSILVFNLYSLFKIQNIKRFFKR